MEAKWEAICLKQSKLENNQDENILKQKAKKERESQRSKAHYTQGKSDVSLLLINDQIENLHLNMLTTRGNKYCNYFNK